MKKNLGWGLMGLFLLPMFSQAAYKMGEAQPVKVSGEDSAPVTAESGTTVSPSTNRKANNVAFPHRDGPSSNPEIEVIAALSQRYGVPEERLEYYRGLHFGYEEIVPSLIVAREAQSEVGRILKLRMDGQSWQAIADSFFVDLQPLNKEVGETLKPIRQRLPKRALTERPANQPSKPVTQPTQQKK